MKQMILLFTFLMAAAFIFTTGCITRKETVVEKAVPAPPAEKEVQKEVIIIKEQPPAIPAPQVEVPGTGPSPDYVWVPGYWDWNGTEYVWMSGKWVKFPTPQATWVPGHWQQTASGWMWVSGYWK